MRIGFDIDGVIVDTIMFCSKEATKNLGYEITCADFVYDFTGLSGVKEYWDANEEYLLCTLDPHEGAIKLINDLKAEHELFFISSRRNSSFEATKNWFDKHGLPKERLFLTNTDSKKSICKELGIELFIEDSGTNAMEVASIGIPVILFHTEYNREYEGENIKRATDWDEIRKIVNNK